MSWGYDARFLLLFTIRIFEFSLQLIKKSYTKSIDLSIESLNKVGAIQIKIVLSSSVITNAKHLWPNFHLGNFRTTWLAPIQTAIQIQPCAYTGSKSAEARLGIEKPKRPLTPFFKFMTQMRPALLAKNPGISNKEAIAWSSKHWQQLDAEVTRDTNTNIFNSNLTSVHTHRFGFMSKCYRCKYYNVAQTAKKKFIDPTKILSVNTYCEDVHQSTYLFFI